MPTNDEILIGLQALANPWKGAAVFWHVYFALLALPLLAGVLPSRRLVGLLFGPPLLSVGILAWVSGNPFNGIVFLVLGGLVMLIAARLPGVNVRIAPTAYLLAGVLLFFFGWFYPHFLETTSVLTYAYAAPVGVIPCPTLSIVIGLALIVDSLQSRALAFVLGLAGVFYGVTGAFRLGVPIDRILLFGAVIILLSGFRKKPVGQ